MIGLAPEKHREALRNAALSLRPLTEVERGAVTGKRLRIVAARQGERLENLAARSGNAWSPAYTALVNGLNMGGGESHSVAGLLLIWNCVGACLALYGILGIGLEHSRITLPKPPDG